MSDRQTFEKWLGETYDSDAEFDHARNCYKEFAVHMAWQAWRGRAALNAGGEAAPTALNVMGLAPKLYGDKYALGSVLFFVASDVPAGEIHLRDGHDGRLLGKIINVGEYVPQE